MAAETRQSFILSKYSIFILFHSLSKKPWLGNFLVLNKKNYNNLKILSRDRKPAHFKMDFSVEGGFSADNQDE